MPATAASQQAPRVDHPKHPMHALTTYELGAYRRQLETALASLDGKDAVAPVRAGLQARLDEVLAEQDDRARIARA
jgi:hypothetical protein